MIIVKERNSLKLSTEFYHNEIPISKEKKDLIDKYINQYEIENYEDKFDENITCEELYYLTATSQNLLNWYPFSSECEILELGGDIGELTGLFCQKCKKVLTVEPQLDCAKAISKRYKNRENLEIVAGNLKDIDLEEKFDIITFIGNIDRIKEIVGEDISLEKTIEYLENFLKENGRILLAIDNKFGLRYWSGNPDNILNKKFSSLIGYHNEPKVYETYTRKSLEIMLKNMGYYTNFYYPLPDYKMPNVIFTDNGLPQYNSIDKYNPYCAGKSDLIINEIDVFREILKTNPEMFTFFTNSFLIEISKETMNLPYKYISFNNLRKAKYRLITKIGEDIVEKQVVTGEAREHLEHMGENINLLKENAIKSLDGMKENHLISKYVDQKYLLNEVLTQELEKGNQKTFDYIIEKYKDILLKNSFKIESYEDTIFKQYNIPVKDENLIKDMNFLENGLWDMTFKNCFYIENEFYFFDQEWRAKHIPVEFILYRSIIYTISLRRYINIEDLMEKYHLKKYREIFDELDSKLQKEIRDDKIWKFYSQNKYFDIEATKQELINVKQRDEAKELAIKNLQKDNTYLLNERENLIKENEELTNKLNYIKKLYGEKLSVKVYRKIKRFLGGKNE